ncbi:hypothetical protein BDY19DRAFT_260704 [Irpex rosettiformis]|uniref:Uncharacterized protein n=1 Tax=Irpex rosettiformis TaxID=378272 RepID=A0ACB8UGW4_9APHY|nr:hypothetical protein BDY19DRAFT_260704 [Irpex rosettiformis]
MLLLFFLWIIRLYVLKTSGYVLLLFFMERWVIVRRSSYKTGIRIYSRISHKPSNEMEKTMGEYSPQSLHDDQAFQLNLSRNSCPTTTDLFADNPVGRASASACLDESAGQVRDRRE